MVGKTKAELSQFVNMFSLSFSQVSGSSVEVGNSDRVAAATAKVEIRRRGLLSVSPQVYGSNFEP